MLLFYDFEVFKYDWLVVIIDPINNIKTVIHNNVDQMRAFYEQHKDNIWVGFNSRSYDQYILKGILLDMDPYEINDWLIRQDKPGWQFSDAFNRIQLYNYDVYKGLTDYGLKTLECFMGNDIRETTVPFNIDRPLTKDELQQTIFYCTHDVEQTIEVFKIRKDEFETHVGLINEFNLPFSNISKTTAQLIGVILVTHKKSFNDEWSLRVPSNLKLKKYKYCADWYLDKNNYDYKKKLETTIAGCPHIFAWGGLHGALKKYSYICKDDELMILADASSLYPSIMIWYDLMSRSIKSRQSFIDIYTKNLVMKNNKDPKRPLYKQICVSAFGCMGDKYNPLYDKLHQNLVCIYGQLLMLDLIEQLEPYIVLQQTNTDGILFKIKKKDFELVDSIINDWEDRVGLSMEFTYAKKLYQKDVNNYVIVPSGPLYDEKGKPRWKAKGAYVKKLGQLDYDLPIVNEALTKYFVENIPIEETINNCNELIKFQKVYKLTGKYDFVEHNKKRYYWKSYRAFASLDKSDTTIFKCKQVDTTIMYLDGIKRDRFSNVPENCKIVNGDIKDVKVPNWLDKQYYIDLAYTRLEQFTGKE